MAGARQGQRQTPRSRRGGKRASVDVVVLNVIAAELEATLFALGLDIAKSGKLTTGTVFWSGNIHSGLAKRQYSLVVGCVARAGNTDTADITGEFIREFQPRFVMLVGIAAGIRGRAKIGHVVVSSTVFAYEPGTMQRHNGRRAITPRPTVAALPHGINQDLMPYLVRSHRLPLPPEAMGGRMPVVPAGREAEYAANVAEDIVVFEGGIASGEKLLRDAEFLKELRSNSHGRIEAGDMESVGLVTACSKAQVPWLIVRGISDFGDELKDDVFHTLASVAAATVAADFLRGGLQLLESEAGRVPSPLRKQIAAGGGGPSSLAGPHHNLPRPDYEAFVGRAEKIEDIAKRLLPYPKSQYSLICIDGAGGIGKSALALKTAYRYLDEFETIPLAERFDQVIWTSAKVTYLHPTGIRYRPRTSRTLEDILRSICTFFDREDLMSKNEDARLDAIYRLLSKGRTLLIVDNLETILDDSVEAFIREIIAPTKVLMTSRQRVDMAYPVRLQGFDLAETRVLIQHHAESRSLEVTDDEIIELHRATGGVPLAIYWSLGLRNLGEPMSRIVEMLQSPAADLARFCFDELMVKIQGTATYSAFMALACFPCDANAKGIAATAGLAEAQCEAAIGQLEFLALANKEPGGAERGGRRFSLPTLARIYAHGELDKNPVERRRYFRGLIGYLKSICFRTPGAYYWRYGTYELYDEGENLRDTLPAVYAYGTSDEVFGLTNAACDYLDYIGDWTVLVEVCREVIGYAESLSDSAAIANFNSTLGWYLIHQHRLDDAIGHLRRAMECYAVQPNPEGQCVVLHRMSAYYRKVRDFQSSEDCCSKALGIASDLDSGDLRALVFLEWGKLDRDRKDWAAADGHFRKVGSWFEARAARSPADEVLSRSVWGHLASVTIGRLDAGLNVDAAELDEAHTLCMRSLEFFFSHGGKSYFATLQFRLARLLVAKGDRTTALEHARLAHQWFRQLDMSEDLEQVAAFLRAQAGDDQR
jgi:nucleoside phosphorylase/tetratricopeptide (TPR) repeat protein